MKISFTMKATLTLITTLLLAPLATLAAQDAPLARPATIPRARVAETRQKGISYQFISLTKDAR